MTGPGYPGAPYQSQSTLALTHIDSTKYPDTNKDMNANVQRLNTFVDYISQYLQTMQKGVDQSNQSAIQKVQGLASNLAELLGNGSLLYDINMGNLQYYLPAIGALFGFDTTTPFPINLLDAVEHLVLGYILPLDAFSTGVNDLFNTFMQELGINTTFIDGVNNVIAAAAVYGGGVTDLFNAIIGIVNIFGVSGASGTTGGGFEPFADMWHSLSIFLGGLSLSSIGAVTDPVFLAMAPWANYTAIALDYWAQTLEAFAGGVYTVTGMLNLANMFGPWVILGSIGTFDALAAWEGLFTNVLTAAGIPPLDASKIISGQFIASTLQPLIDAIAVGIGGPLGLGFTALQSLLGTVVFDVLTGPALLTLSTLNYLPVALLGVGSTVNMLFNPTLDVDASNWAFTTGAVSASRDATVGHANVGSIKFTGTAGVASASSNLVPVVPFQPVAATAWYKSDSTSSTTLYLTIAEYDLSQIFLRYRAQTSISLTGTTSWVSTSIDPTYTASADTAYVALIPSVNFPGNGTAHFDDFSLIKYGSILDSLVPGIGAIINTILGSLGYAETQLYTDLDYALAHIPGGNIISIATSQLTGFLDASVINTGTFLASLIPNLNASIITAGSFLQSLIPSLSASWGGIINSSNIPVLHETAISANIVISPGFEDNTFWPGAAGVQSTDQAHSGTHSRKLTGNNTLTLTSTDNGATTLHTFPGDSYILSTYIWPKTGNTGGGTVKVQILCADSTGNHSPTTTVVATETVPATGSWTALGANVVVPSGYDTITPQLVTSSIPSGDVIYVDDVSIREISYPQSILDQIINAFFGTGFGHTLLDLYNILIAIPAANISGALTAATLATSRLVGFLDASIVTTGTLLFSLLPINAIADAIIALFPNKYGGLPTGLTGLSDLFTDIVNTLGITSSMGSGSPVLQVLAADIPVLAPAIAIVQGVADGVGQAVQGASGFVQTVVTDATAAETAIQAQIQSVIPFIVPHFW